MSPIGATILRVMLGVTYIFHAYHVWNVTTPDAFAAFVNRQTGLSFSEQFVWYLIVAQFLGGVLMILGLGTRWAVVANIPALVVPVILLHFQEGYFLHVAFLDAARSSAEVAGYEYALFVLIATVAQFFLGTGALGLMPHD